MNTRESNLKIVELLAKGLTIKEVAAKMNMGKRTIDARILVLKKKFQSRTLPQLVVKVLIDQLAYFSEKE
jgi:DNA-binding NarL/FixJ family response regulator